MFTISVSEVMRRPISEVFQFAGDYANDPAWRSGVLAMRYEQGSEPAAGARTHETMRSMGRTVATVAEITEYSGSRTAFRSISGPVACDGAREFASAPEGTRMTYSLTLRPEGFLRLLEPLLHFMFQRQVKGDMLRLKGLLEDRA